MYSIEEDTISGHALDVTHMLTALSTDKSAHGWCEPLLVLTLPAQLPQISESKVTLVVNPRQVKFVGLIQGN